MWLFFACSNICHFFKKDFLGTYQFFSNMFSCFGQSYFSLPQKISPFPYHSIIFLFVQHVLLIYVIFLVIYTTHCLDHISFQANCPNLWNVKIVPNKILPYEHYIFIFNTTNFYHMQMCWCCWSFPFPCTNINITCTNKKYNHRQNWLTCDHPVE